MDIGSTDMNGNAMSSQSASTPRQLRFTNSGQTANAGASRAGLQQKGVHEASGYSWDREEDAPGFAWKNRKVQEEAQRQWNVLAEKDKMITSELGV